jgi:site-specific recombinase XerD
MIDRGLSPATQVARLLGVRSFCRWLLAEGIIETDPSAGVSGPSVKAVPVKPMTAGEIKAVMAACRHPHERAMIALLAATGMRVGELAGITVRSLDMTNRRVFVDGKTGPRTIPFSDEAAAELGRYLRARKSNRHAGCPELWLSARGPMSREAVRDAIRNAGKRAGVEDGVNPHRYRHTFASGWLDDGGSEQAAMKILGWTNRKQLDRYTALTAEGRAIEEYRRRRR